MAKSNFPRYMSPPSYKSVIPTPSFSSSSQEEDSFLSIFDGKPGQYATEFDSIFGGAPVSFSGSYVDAGAGSSSSGNVLDWGKSIGLSAGVGIVDIAQNAADFAFSSAQKATTGVKSTLGNIKTGSLNEDQQKLIDQYNESIKTGKELDKETKRKLLNINFGANAGLTKQETFDITTGKQDVGTPKLTSARKGVYDFFQQRKDKLATAADVEGKPKGVQFFANIAQSSPYTAISRLSYVGFIINYSSMYQGEINNQILRFQQDGIEITPELMDNIQLFAIGSAVVEAGSEQIFPAAKGAMGQTIKTIAKYMAKQMGQEAAEEVLSYWGQGLIAKLTVDPNAKITDLITVGGTLESAASGAVMAGIYSGVGMLAGYKRTKKAVKTKEDKIGYEITPEDVSEVETAIKQDAQEQNNVDEIFDVVNDAAFTMSQKMDTETEAKAYEATVANLRQKASEQEYGSIERSETEATVKTAEAHLKELYRQQQEAITQTPVEGARSPVQEQVVSEPIQTVQQPSVGAQDATQASQADTVVKPKKRTQSEVKKIKAFAEKLISDGLFVSDNIESAIRNVESRLNTWEQTFPEDSLQSHLLFVRSDLQAAKANREYVDDVIKKGEVTWANADAVANRIGEDAFIEQYPELAYLVRTPQAQPKVAQQAHATEQEKPVEKKKKPTVAQERAKTYDMLVEKVASGQDVTQEVKDWVNSKDPIAVKLRTATSTDGKLDADKLTDFAMQMEDKIKTNASKGLKLPKNFLQLLGGYTLAQQLERGEKGEAVTRYMAHLVEALEAGRPADVIKKIDEAVTRDDIWHEMLANKETIEKSERLINNAKKRKGGEITYYKSVAEKVLNWNGDINTTPNVTPDELVTLSKYAKLLIEQDLIGSAHQLATNLSKVLTNYGRSTQAAILLKTVFPEYKAERLVREFEKSTEPLHEKKQYFEDKVADVVGKAGQVRKDAINDVAGDIDNAVKAEPKPKEPKEKKTPGQILADMVEKFATKPETNKKVADFEQRLLARLFAKAKESMTRNMADRISRSKEDIANEKFSILAEIVLNRGIYAQVWNDAQSIIDQNTDIAENSQIVEFLRTLADPISSEAFIQSVVTANIGMMNKSVTELAKDFFFRGDESIDQFLNELRKNMPAIDDASFEYVKTHVGLQFALKMAARRQALRIMFEESIKKTRGKKQKVMNMQEVMIKQLMDATFYDSLRIPEIEKQFARLMGMPYLNEEMKQDIYDTMHRVAKITDPFEVENQIEAMQRRIAEQIPPTWDEKMKAIARTAMLLNPVSWLRNTASNLGTSPFYKWQDKMVNRMLKSWGNPLSQIAGEKWIPVDADSYIGKAVLSNSTTAHLERVRNKTAKYTWKQLFAYEKKYFETPWLQKATQIPNEVMNVGAISRKNKAPLNVKILSDSYMFEKYFRYALANKLNAMGYSETMTEEQRTKTMEQAKEYAGEISVIRTFRMSSIISDAIKGLNQSVMGYDTVREYRLQGRHAEADARLKRGKTAQAAIFLATPFVVTPAALITQGYRFSPLSLAVGLVRKQVAIKKGNLQMDGRDISIANQIAQGTVGTIGQFAIGMLLGALGFLDAAPPENEKEKQAWKLAGRRAYSIRTPWGSYSLDWLQPISTGLFMGAQFGDALAGFVNKDYTFGESLKQMPTVFIDNLFQNTMLDNVRSKFTSYDGKMSTVLTDNLQDSIFMFMPNLLARANKAIDPYVRDVYSGNALEVMAKRIALYVPFASLALPPKIDIWGNPTKKSKLPEPLAFMDRVIFQFASPFIRTEAYLDPVSKEVLDVFEKTKTELGNKALPGILSKVDDDMTGQEWVDYQAMAGQLSKAGVEKLISSSRYKNLSDKAKAEALDKVYRDARAKAKKEYLDNKKP